MFVRTETLEPPEDSRRGAAAFDSLTTPTELIGLELATSRLALDDARDTPESAEESTR